MPGLLTVGAYVVDLALGSDLIIRSLLGPNPRSGSRYYGIGNELEATLPVLLLIGLAALLTGRGRTRGPMLAFALSGLALGVAIGAGRLGADVGGVITVGAGTAAATLLMLPGGVTRRALVIAALVPGLALAGLAALDLATGGDGHFTRTVLRAQDGDALWDIFTRRYELAFNALQRGLMPFATGLALLAIAYGAAPPRAHLRAAARAIPPGARRSPAGWSPRSPARCPTTRGRCCCCSASAALAVVTAYVRGDPRLAEPTPEPESGPIGGTVARTEPIGAGS